jgi:lipopolysaccharide export system protein LptA
MASVKKFNGNLIIQTPVKTGTNANITLDTDFVIITGNLNVRGNTTIINSNTQTITDNILHLIKVKLVTV